MKVELPLAACLALTMLATVSPACAWQPDKAPADPAAIAIEESGCIKCHGESDLWEGDTRRLFVTDKNLADDIHWQKGIRCHACHGGDAETTNFLEAHATESGFRSVKSPTDIPKFCGHCHSDIEYMTRYQPSPKTTQWAEYLTSGHGKRLTANGDEKVATCVSCHGGHGIRSPQDIDAPVYPTRVAETCAKCHSNAEQMAGYDYHGKPLGHDQFDRWSKSVHAQALAGGDLSAATCNDCHGNHGTVVPEPTAIANACGKCHVKAAELFTQTRMKHRFQEVNLPSCSACHGNHEIHHPTDEMLGMQAGAVCVQCHADGKFGATLAGEKEARQMHDGLERLKQSILAAQSKIDAAKRLGMEVRGPHFDLRAANQSLTNARSLVHSFSFQPMSKEIDAGLQVAAEVDQRAQHALDEHTNRRIWLAVSLIPILLVIALLLLYIRALALPSRHNTAEP